MEKPNKKDRKQLAIAARERKFFARCAVGCALAIIAGLLAYNSSRPQGPSGYQAVLKDYISRHRQPDQSWLTGREDPVQEIAAINSWSGRVGALLDQHRSVSNLTGRIHQHFRDFRVSKFANGVSHSIVIPMPGVDVEAILMREATQFEVCVITPSQRGHPSLLPNCLYYRQDWRAVMADSVVWTDAFLAALMYHELGHALRHCVDRAASATAPDKSDAWIGEEVEMHQLEHQILDVAVQGRFTLLLDGIIDRLPQGEPSPEFYQAMADEVTVEDWQAYDALFGLQGAGVRMTSIHTAQFMISLGFRLIERRFPQTKTQNQIDYYRFMFSNLKMKQ